MSYKEIPFTKNRRILSEIYEQFHKMNYMIGFVEVDVTDGRAICKKSPDLSFTGWIISCLAQAAQENMMVNAYRKKNKIIIFDDIDIIVMVEREINEKVIPIPVSIRQADTKNVIEISREIREAQNAEVDESQQLLENDWKTRFFHFIPRFVRRWIIQRISRDPHYIIQQGGGIVVTSVGMFANTGGWISGFGGLTTLNIAVGGISKRLKMLEGAIVEREHLHLTINIDHDIMDGAPATRFASRFVELLQNSFGL